MSAGLSHRHVFGVNGAVPNGISFSDQTTLLYVAGHNLVFYDILEKSQRFIHGTEGCAAITALAICPNSKFVAVAESQGEHQICIYDLRTLRKRKSLAQPADTATREFVSIAFSHDSNLLLTQGGAPNWTLSLWNWHKARLLGQVSTSDSLPVYACTFSPVDASLACVTGNNVFRFYRVKESGIHAMPLCRVREHNFLSHAWLKQPEDHLVLGTEKGQLILFRRFICHLAVSLGDDTQITSLVAFAQGFIAGCSDGKFALLTLNNDDQASPTTMFELTHSWTADCNGHITSMAVCQNEEQLCVVTSDCQLLSVSLTAPTITGNAMQPVLDRFHAPGINPGGITGMDCCIRKPLVATCGMDRTVRIWNFVEHKLEICKSFAEEAFSVAMHPSGLHIIVGFADKLRLLNLLMDTMTTFRELPVKQCREVKFSNGGQWFAAVNGNAICIYDFLTQEKITDLRGHNSKVRHLFWGLHDETLISCGQDGAIYQWDTDEGKRLAEYVLKGTVYTCALQSGDSVFAVGTDRVLMELEVSDLQVVKELEGGAMLTQIALSSSERIMCVGTGEAGKPGYVRAYSFPLTGDYLEYPCMGAPITRMCLTHDDMYLMVADEAGSLFIFDVRDRHERGQAGSKVADGKLQSMPYADEILVTLTDLEDKNTLMGELKNKVDELALHNEYQLRLKDMTYSEELKEITEKYTAELEQGRNKYMLLKEEKSDLGLEYEERYRQMEEKHQHDLQALENNYQQKIMSEVERYQTLVQDRLTQQERWQDQQALLVTTHERYVTELTADFEQKLEEDCALRQQLEEENKELEAEFQETKTQLEDDIDTEVDTLQKRFEAQLAAEREATLHYKGENRIMKKKFTVLTKDIEDQREETKTLQEKGKELQAQIAALEKDIVLHKREIMSRDDTIGEKEKKIYELKKKNQELEKFKFVLDYKIKELKLQIEPRKIEIGAMKDQIKEMDTELEQFHNSNASLDLLIGDLRKKLDSMQEEIILQRKRLADLEAASRRLKTELHECVELIQSPEELLAQVKKMYTQHVSEELPQSEVDPNVQHEHHRAGVGQQMLHASCLVRQLLMLLHKEYLERRMLLLREKFLRDVGSHRMDNLGIMQDNMMLIREINMQREGNKACKRQLQARLNVLKRLGQTAPVSMSMEDPESGQDPQTLIESNRIRITELRDMIRRLESDLTRNGTRSKEILPPMDGVEPATPET
ncbi:unnamed protein product [Chrysoparadoxa australica]